MKNNQTHTQEKERNKRRRRKKRLANDGDRPMTTSHSCLFHRCWRALWTVHVFAQVVTSLDNQITHAHTLKNEEEEKKNKRERRAASSYRLKRHITNTFTNLSYKTPWTPVVQLLDCREYKQQTFIPSSSSSSYILLDLFTIFFLVLAFRSWFVSHGTREIKIVASAMTIFAIR